MANLIFWIFYHDHFSISAYVCDRIAVEHYAGGGFDCGLFVAAGLFAVVDQGSG